MKFRNPFKKKKQDDPSDNTLEFSDKSLEETVEDEEFDDDISLDDLELESDQAVTYNKKKMAGAVLAVVALTFGGVSSYNFFTSTTPTQAEEHVETNTSSANSNNSPAGNMPSQYAELSKYKEGQQQSPNNKPNTNSNTTQNTTPHATPVTSSNYTAPSPSASANNAAAAAARNEAARKAAEAENNTIMSPIAFRIANAVTQSVKASSPSQPYNTAPNNSPIYLNGSNTATGSSYTLVASSIIPATLLTGISTDIANNEVVAVVRQNVYDSLTGKHLLIPQGSRIIGKAGTQGGKGVKRVGVVFERIILPNNQSINLPNLPTIDGTGMPGMKDKYDEHLSSLFKTAFMSSLVGAIAQSATGDTEGSDNRSPGQEAVSGAVAQIEAAASSLINQAANQQATIEIRPGKEFSIFVTSDLLIPEYSDDYI